MSSASPSRASKPALLLVIVALLAAVAGGGYWAGQRAGQQAEHRPGAESGAGGASSAKPLYYRNPMGLPDTSPTPKKDPMGMDYIPVFAAELEAAAAVEAATEAAAEAGKGSQVVISAEKVQKLGVRSEAAQMRSLDKVVRAAGRVEPDEGRSYAIAPKFEGYVERLYVNSSGQAVAKGQPLFEVYSPELVSAQREYALAAQGVEALKGSDSQAGMKQLAEASLQRLRNWDVSAEQVQALAKSGEVRRSLTFRSPVAGVVSEKKAQQGMRFMAGEVLYQLTDLSSLWIIADVAEQDIGAIRLGAKAQVKIDAYPERTFAGAISYIYPTLKSETRSVAVRIQMANPGGLLKPGMFAQVELPVAAREPQLTIPLSAVIDSGTRQMALVQLAEGRGEGRFQPRQLKLGARSDNYVVVLEGVAEGERVVVAANFLIDAESNLKAALGGLSAANPPIVPAAEATSAKPAKPAVASVGHQAQGKVEEVDAKGGSVSISHGPVASLKWPAMTMEFQVANSALLNILKPGARVAFEFVERGQGEWVITSAKATAAPAAADASTGHAGH